MDPLELIILLAGIAMVGALVRLGVRGITRSLADDRWWDHGVPITARVAEVRETGARLGRQADGSRELEVTLVLAPSGVRRTVRFFPKAGAAERLVPGEHLEVRVARDDETRVVIDPAIRLV